MLPSHEHNRKLDGTAFVTCTPGGVLPYMGYIGMCGPKGYGFSAVLVINRVSILAILVINGLWFLHSSLDMGTFLRRSHCFIIIEKNISKSPFTKYVYGNLTLVYTGELLIRQV